MARPCLAGRARILSTEYTCTMVFVDEFRTKGTTRNFSQRYITIIKVVANKIKFVFEIRL